MFISEIWNKFTEFERQRIFQKSDGDFKVLRNE